MRILKGLDDIDWSSLTHAYGTADDVPDLLNKRASQNLEEAKQSEYELFGNILHQGTVYDATSYAVPFLVELLQNHDTHERYGLIILLAGIANGTGYFQVHGAFDFTQKAFGAVKINAETAKEAIFVPRAHAAVAKYTESFIQLLDDKDERVRRHIPCLLATIPVAHEWLRKNALPRAMETTDSILATNLLFALSHVIKNQSEWAIRVTSARLPDYPMAYIAIAHVVLLSGNVELAKDATEIAVRPLLKSDEYVGYFRDSYYFEFTEVQQQFWSLLPKIPLSTRPAMLATLIQVLPILDDIDAGSIASSVLLWVFDPNHIPGTLEELSMEQRIILKQLDRVKNTLHIDNDYRRVLSSLDKSGVLKKLGIQSRGLGW